MHGRLREQPNNFTPKRARLLTCVNYELYTNTNKHKQTQTQAQTNKHKHKQTQIQTNMYQLLMTTL